MSEMGTSNGGGDKQNPQTSDLKQKGKLTEKETSSGGDEVRETIHQRRSDAPNDQVPPHTTETSNSRGEQQPRRRVMPKVPALLIEEEKNKEDYIPKVVSIGPYHHSKPGLGLAEAFKPKAVEMFVSGGEPNHFYYDKVFERIDEIRSCYEEEATKTYSNSKLAEMMLCDACFIIIRMEANMPAEQNREMGRIGARKHAKYWTMDQNLGRLKMALSYRDLLLLENQIPFWIVKLFITLRYKEDEGEELLNRWLCTRSTGRDLEAGVDTTANADPSAENGVNPSTGVKCTCLCCQGVRREGPEDEVERIPHFISFSDGPQEKGHSLQNQFISIFQ
ncbi:UNVERIFIED_CONTAM: hypothetical protein Sradi_1563400 [Sesamum radiatum]|uniref:Uncharacterized protein n=1 Tax=Sesamum radiatum TaxID=300843 RepID=A0AAW2UA89_SESRA